MRHHRFWIEIVLLGTAAACALALLMATLGAAAAGAFQHPQESPSVEQTFEGVVTCSRCGARHSAELGRTAADCTLICVHGGAQFAFVNGDKVYLLEGNPYALKKVAGQRTTIVGTMSGNTIHVSSVAGGAY